MLLTMSISTLTAVVVVANVLGGAMAVPQAAKLIRSRRVDGVSPVWAGISATVNAWWAAYGIGIGDLSIVPVSVVSVMAYLAIAVALVRYGSGRAWATVGRLTAWSGAIALVPLAALAVDGWATAGVVLGALYGVQLSPAVVAVYRAPDVSGVSTATWGIAFAEAALWGVYGLARLDVGLLTLAATGLVMSSLVLARLFLRRPRRQRRDATAGLRLSPA
jgi:uncharacterized protein with PQ loop repeat